MTLTSGDWEINQAAPGVAAVVEWDDPSAPNAQAEVQIRENGETTWFKAERVEAADSVVKIGPVIDGQAYDARVRFIGGGGGATGYTTVLNQTLQAGAGALPAPALSFVSGAISTDTPYSALYTASTDPTIWKVNVYRNSCRQLLDQHACWDGFS